MHKININLHNSKTDLIFSMEISRDVSTWFTYVAKKKKKKKKKERKKNVAPRPRSEGGGGGGGVGIHPPPAVRWGQKTRLFKG